MKPGGRPPPINARREGIATNGLFKSAYRSRRCLVPINGYFEWKDIYGTGKNKQPYAIAMADDSPFALAGIWDTWRDPATGADIRNFAVVTCPPNEMMADIHDRMPVVLHRDDYERWLSLELDPDDLMKPYPAEQMKMWPIDRKVGSPKNDTADVIERIDPDPEPTMI
jgi:putative SOS response-associated peptidase YedK